MFPSTHLRTIAEEMLRRGKQGLLHRGRGGRGRGGRGLRGLGARRSRFSNALRFSRRLKAIRVYKNPETNNPFVVSFPCAQCETDNGTDLGQRSRIPERLRNSDAKPSEQHGHSRYESGPRVDQQVHGLCTRNPEECEKSADRKNRIPHLFKLRNSRVCRAQLTIQIRGTFYTPLKKLRYCIIREIRYCVIRELYDMLCQ